MQATQANALTVVVYISTMFILVVYIVVYYIVFSSTNKTEIPEITQ